METCNSGIKVAVLHVKTTNEGWDLERLVILMLKSLFWMHKTTDEGRDQLTSVILDLSTLFCIQKSTGEVWDPSTCNSDPKVPDFHVKTTDEVWDQ